MAVSCVCLLLFAGMCVLTYILRIRIIPEPVYESQLEDEDEEDPE